MKVGQGGLDESEELGVVDIQLGRRSERKQAADEGAAATQRCRELPLIFELEFDLWSKRIHFAQSLSATFPHI